MEFEMERIDTDLSVCKLERPTMLPWNDPFFFLSQLENYWLLICQSEHVPLETISVEDGWCGFCISGPLSREHLGALYKMASVLSGNGIGIFTISTMQTEYVLTKQNDIGRALEVLQEAGFEVR